MRRFFVTGLWVVITLGLLVLLGFVNKEQKNILCRSLDINIQQDGHNFFVSKEDVRKIIQENGDSVIGQPLSSININQLEERLDNNPDIDKSQIYVTVNGEMKVNITQRDPIVRVYNQSGESFYIDHTGQLMPLSDKFTPRVMVVTGNVDATYAKNYTQPARNFMQDTTIHQPTMLDDIYTMAQYIDGSKFWKAQIQQMYVDSDHEFVLIPRVGDQQIIFGNATDIDKKFNKLMIFYTQGLNPTGRWKKYKTINLKYENQVVCTRK